MIKQKYDYEFFYNNYRYRCNKMFKNYYKNLSERYKYQIIMKYKDNLEVYRSNLDSGSILNIISNTKSDTAEVINVNSVFPECYKWEYININGNKQITKVYKNNLSETRKTMDNKLIYNIWWSKKGNYTILEDIDSISISYGSYRITNRNNENKITVHKSTPLSQGCYLDYNTDHKEMIEKVLKVLINENIEGFYDKMIARIKLEFGIK